MGGGRGGKYIEAVPCSNPAPTRRKFLRNHLQTSPVKQFPWFRTSPAEDSVGPVLRDLTRRMAGQSLHRKRLLCPWQVRSQQEASIPGVKGTERTSSCWMEQGPGRERCRCHCFGQQL